MMKTLSAFLKRYLGLMLSLAIALVVLTVFLWWWSQAGHPIESGMDVVSAFSTLMVAVSALLIGQGLRQRQEEAAHARAELALNIELITRILPHEGFRVLEVEVRVKNISSKSWNLPMAYVFVHPVDLSIAAAGTSPRGISVPEIWKLRGVNVARFANTMTRLCPDEEEVFSKAYLLDELQVQRSPFLLVLVEAIGAPDSHGFSKADRLEFDMFMNGEPKNGGVTHDLEGLPIRDTYMVIETTERGLREKHGRRVLVLPPSEQGGEKLGQEGRIDSAHTKRFRSMLDDTMMWSRSRVVCVGDARSRDEELAHASAAQRLPQADGYRAERGSAA